MELIDRITHRLKVRDLRLLDAVVRTRSMAKAARQLNVSQPAVSKAIVELERAFDVQLLHRSRQGIEPTDYGRALLQCGVAVPDQIQQGVRTIESLRDPAVGEVRIGSSAFLAVSFASTVVDRLSRRYPRIVFHLITAPAGMLYRELNTRNLDLVITRKFGSAADEKLDFEALFDDSFVVAAGAQNKWARRRKIRLGDLVDEPWVLPPAESVITSVATEAFRASGLQAPHPTVIAFAPETRMAVLAFGRYLSIFPTSVLRFPTRRADIKVLPVELPVPRTPTGIVTLKNRTLNPAARLFIDSAREVAKPLAKL